MMFFNPATTASSLQTAAELERLGGDLNRVSRLVSKNKNVNSLVLWGKALERLNGMRAARALPPPSWPTSSPVCRGRRRDGRLVEFSQ